MPIVTEKMIEWWNFISFVYLISIFVHICCNVNIRCTFIRNYTNKTNTL